MRASEVSVRPYVTWDNGTEVTEEGGSKIVILSTGECGAEGGSPSEQPARRWRYPRQSCSYSLAVAELERGDTNGIVFSQGLHAPSAELAAS